MGTTKTIEDILGQTYIYNAIIDDKTFSLIDGISAPAGQGKHYLIRKIENYYQETPGIVPLRFSPRCSCLERDQDYGPFLFLLSEIEKTTRTNLSNLGKNVSVLIPYIGNAVSKVLEQKKIYPAIFSSVEVELLVRIERVVGFKDVVFLCEEIDQWDRPSVRFLHKLFSYSIGARKAKYICTMSNADLEISDIFDRKFELHSISDQSIGQVIQTLFPTNHLNEETIKKIISLSNGNIGIVIQLCKLIDENGFDLIDEHSIYRSITLQKLQSVLNELKYNQTIGLLDHASLIGERSYKKLLQIFTRYNPLDFSESINISVENDILSDDIESVVFKNKSIWLAFREENFRNKQFHFELAKCVQTLMPSFFTLIGEELLYAGQEQEAAVYFILSLLNYYHTYRSMPSPDTMQINLMKKYHLYEPYQILINLYSHYFSGELNIVQQSRYYFNDRRLLFEADYVKALANINGSVKRSVYAQAVQLLESWVSDDQFLSECPYQWMRAALLTLSARCEFDSDPPQSLLIQIERVKRNYAINDTGMVRLEYDFLSKCNSCYSVDTAYYYTKQAEEYFKMHLDNTPSAYPYLVSLINTSANSLVIGKYSEAIEYSLKALEFIRIGYPSFESTVAIINNLLIAGLLSNTIKREEIDIAILQLRKVLSEISEDTISEILLRNNIAIMLCYKGEVTTATREMQKLYCEYQYIDDLDEYYQYVIGSNICVLTYLSGISKFDMQQFEKICQLHPLVQDQSYFSARNQCIKDRINASCRVDFSQESWNDLGSSQVGPAWSFWGKWLIFSDIQIWSD